MKNFFKQFSFKLFLKSMSITVCFFLFFGAMFIAMNETRRSMDGNAYSVFSSSNGVIVTKGEQMWTIKKDVDAPYKIVDFLKNHTGVLPLPIQLFTESTKVTKDLEPILNPIIINFNNFISDLFSND